MTPKAMRLAIAESQGWKIYKAGDGVDYWINPKTPDGFGGSEPPDYCNDLKAMHEAELSLTDAEHDHYQNHLASITNVLRYPKNLAQANDYCSQNSRAFCSATAQQRAKAFLKVKGLWKD